jgi:hypothetical protein
MLNAITLSVVLLSVVMLSVIMLSVVALYNGQTLATTCQDKTRAQCYKVAG